MNSNKLDYHITQKDIERCFKFTLKYHLDKKKGSISRTSGQYRGLGGIIDSFFIGKIIEIGVASIIEQFTSKKMVLDFKIHKPNDDPDIININKNNKKRLPKLYVEIKNSPKQDRWIGLSAGQFNTILKKKFVSTNPKNLIIVGATIITKKIKNNDLLGVFLKSKLDYKLMKKFVDPADLRVRIKYILYGDELKKYGVAFNKGSLMYENEIFEKVTKVTFNKITNPKNINIYQNIQTNKNIFPIIMSSTRNKKNKPVRKPREFGKITYKGNLKLFVKYNAKSDKSFVQCISNVTVKNKVIGDFYLKK